jgi:hypothetical protein
MRAQHAPALPTSIITHGLIRRHQQLHQQHPAFAFKQSGSSCLQAAPVSWHLEVQDECQCRLHRLLRQDAVRLIVGLAYDHPAAAAAAVSPLHFKPTAGITNTLDTTGIHATRSTQMSSDHQKAWSMCVSG